MYQQNNNIQYLQVLVIVYDICYRDPYSEDLDDTDEDYIKPMKVDIDLALSAYANARK